MSSAGHAGPADTTTDRPLYALRVHSHAPSLTELVTALAAIGGWLRHEHGVRTVFLQRGWLHGAHVDLVARDEPRLHVPWSELRDRVDAVARHLPEASRTEQDYLRAATELGALELVEPPYLPLAAHRCVRELTAAEVNPWHGDLARLREAALAAMFEPLRHTAAEPTRGQVLAAVAEAFAVLADTHPWGMAFGTFSFRSHAEAFLHFNRGGGDMRARFADRLAADRTRMEAVVRTVLDGGESRSAARWRSAFAYCSGRFEAATDAGVLTVATVNALAPDARLARPSRAFDPADLAQPSRFHAEVAASGVTRDPGDWFAAYRLLLNLFYRQLPLLDVSPLQRFYLCHAVAETVDAVTGETWRERLARVSP